ncbi:MAG: hypothetical protein IT381_20700 [Deltaproteobacteria bacterium]|nr:hypothetical protein [Deltaproteobacteria bacterium]
MSLAVCVSNGGYRASLELRKIYALIPDPDAKDVGAVRVIDESGEDYVYPRRLFAEIQLSPKLTKTLAALA